jgi:hypothetical protein
MVNSGCAALKPLHMTVGAVYDRAFLFDGGRVKRYLVLNAFDGFSRTIRSITSRHARITADGFQVDRTCNDTLIQFGLRGTEHGVWVGRYDHARSYPFVCGFRTRIHSYRHG